MTQREHFSLAYRMVREAHRAALKHLEPVELSPALDFVPPAIVAAAIHATFRRGVGMKSGATLCRQFENWHARRNCIRLNHAAALHRKRTGWPLAQKSRVALAQQDDLARMLALFRPYRGPVNLGAGGGL